MSNLQSELKNKSYKSILNEKFISLAEKYLQTGNIDSYYSGFNAQLIDMMTELSTENRFVASMLYREGYLTEAVTDESIDNWSTYLNYESEGNEPSRASLTLLLTVREDNPFRVTIAANSLWSVGTIHFTNPYEVDIINYTNNKVVAQTTAADGIEELPRKYIYDPQTKTYNLMVSGILLEQYEIIQEEIIFPTVTTYEFKTFHIDMGSDVNLYDLQVLVNNEEFNTVKNMQGFKTDPKSVMYQSKGSKLFLTFGNGILGYLPFGGDRITVNIKTTLGENGAVASGDIRIKNKNSFTIIGESKPEIFTLLPEAAQGGFTEDRDMTKINAIKSFRTNKRYVTAPDIQDFFDMLSLNTPIYIQKTRCDIIGTEDSVFITIPDVDNVVVPATTESITLIDSFSQNVGNVIIPKGQSASIGDFNYSVPMELSINTDTNKVIYRTRVDSPALKFKIDAEYESNNINETYFTPNTATLSLDTTYATLANDKIQYEVILEYSYNDDSVTDFQDFNIAFNSNESMVISRAETVDDEYYTGFATLSSNSIEFDLFSNANAGTPIMDYAGVIEYAEFATDVDKGLTTRRVKFNKGYTPLTNNESVQAFMDGALTEMIINFSVNNIIQTDSYFKFNVLVDKDQSKLNFDMIGFLQLENSQQDLLIEVNYKSTILNNFDSELMSSIVLNSVGDEYEISRVPLIEQTYYEEKMDEIGPYLENIMVTINSKYKAYRMQNVDINLKFSKTYGEVRNIFLNQDEKFYDENPEWNTRMIFNVEIYPDPKIKIDPIILIDNVKDTIMSYVNENQGYHTELIVSKIQSKVQNIDGIKSCNILSPIDNLVYNFDLSKVTRSQLLEFVPEYIHTTRDSIFVEVVANL